MLLFQFSPWLDAGRMRLGIRAMCAAGQIGMNHLTEEKRLNLSLNFVVFHSISVIGMAINLQVWKYIMYFLCANGFPKQNSAFWGICDDLYDLDMQFE